MQRSEKIWRGVLYVGVALALGLGLVDAIRGGVLAEGTKAPELVGKRADDGARFTLAEVQGKVTLLAFWASWCGACRHELPILRKLENEYRDKGLALVTVNVDPDTGTDIANWFGSLGPPLVVVPDGASARAWRVKTLPTLYLLDREGTIVLGRSGTVSAAVLRQQIDAALGR